MYWMENNRRLFRPCRSHPTNQAASQRLQPHEYYRAHASAGVEITSEPLVARGRLLHNPSIEYGDSTSVVPDAAARWDSHRKLYLNPAKVTKWSVVVISNGRSRELLSEPMLKQFVQSLISEARSRGIEVHEPRSLLYGSPVCQEISYVFKVAASSALDFLFFITTNEITTVHCHLKRLEREHEIVTKDLMMGTALEIVCHSKKHILENIVNKFNMKNGGPNYTLHMPRISGSQDLFPNDRMVIGIATSMENMCHRRDLSRSTADQIPTVIGVAVNIKSDPGDFIGDYLLQRKNPCSGRSLTRSWRSGTTRVPRYTVLQDDAKMSMDEVEHLTYGLSFGRLKDTHIKA
ncbi:hypothetical protein QR680_002016 [Steinernema hermaphroditum]|uniref:Piwi domain-containing protein n=1 Tax=Steinernema hermaphroditum TaxID=289476 RepID=A0AA39H1P4_9BILA|nr:hypothetical protein QR680_002016 [Steinernema hermaphroditum]